MAKKSTRTTAKARTKSEVYGDLADNADLTKKQVAGLFGPMGKAFVDRCTSIVLSSQGLSKPFARLAHRIAGREGLDGKPVATYENAIRRPGVKNSLRALLQRIQQGDFLD